MKLQELLEKYDQAETFLGITDPESEPYKSKYECRKILEEIISLVQLHNKRYGESIDHSNAVEASLYCLLGCIDVEVQELAEGEKDLLASLKLLENVKRKEFSVLTAVKAYNQLGVLWCIREDQEKAKCYLDKSQAAYDEFNQIKNENQEECSGYNIPGIYGLRDLLSIENLSSDVPNTHEKEKV